MKDRNYEDHHFQRIAFRVDDGLTSGLSEIIDMQLRPFALVNLGKGE